MKKANPFGITDSETVGVRFSGTPDELNRALGKSLFVVKPKLVLKKKDATGVKIVVRSPAKPVPTVVPAAPVTEKRPLKTKKKKPKPFDRNRDGASDTEIQRARHLITNVIEVDPEVKQKYISSLEQLTREITNFLVTEIAPFESAMQAAMSDAEENIQLITGAQEASFSLGKAERVIQKLPELKIIDFVCTKLQIPADIRASMIADYLGNDHGTKLSELQSLQNMYRQAQESNVRLQELRRDQDSKRKEKQEQRAARRKRTVESRSRKRSSRQKE